MKNPDIVIPESAKSRLLSLDALRGFDMLWIAGGGTLINVLASQSDAGWLDALAIQMDHVRWEGFHFFDLIFPLFMFIAGVAMPFSVDSKLSAGVHRKTLVIKAFKRMVVLFLLGLLYNGVFRSGFENARYVSVLAQIGIAYFFASLIVLFSKSFKATLYWLAGILLGVTFLQLFFPVPGIGAGILTPEGCINGYIDRLLVPGRLAYGIDGNMVSGNGILDALGILSIVSAVGITLMGTIAGKILQGTSISGYRKTGILAVTGSVLIVAGIALSPFYPIIKVCWTTTYNLLAGGISFILMALFYLVIDVWRFQKWAFFFRVIGMNSIFIYLLTRIVPMGVITGYFIGWIIEPSGRMGEVTGVLGIIAGEWLLLYFMYRNKIFIKV